MARFARTVPDTLPASRGVGKRRVLDASVLPGSAMLVWSGAIHLHLWSAGYRSIPTIGWLFLFQAVSAFVLAASVLLTRRPVVAAAGALFLAATAIGLVWSVEWGLFDFQDSFGAPFATQSLGVETAGAVALAVAGAVIWRFGHRPGGRASGRSPGGPGSGRERGAA